MSRAPEPLGHRVWAVPGGHIPVHSSGPEPERTSHDTLCILNTGASEAKVQIHVHLEDQDPLGPFCVEVPPRRVRHVRVNDLIDPRPVPLGTPYAAVLRADVPVVVMFLRADTGRSHNALLGTMAFPLDAADP